MAYLYYCILLAVILTNSRQDFNEIKYHKASQRLSLTLITIDPLPPQHIVIPLNLSLEVMRFSLFQRNTFEEDLSSAEGKIISLYILAQ